MEFFVPSKKMMFQPIHQIIFWLDEFHRQIKRKNETMTEKRENDQEKDRLKRDGKEELKLMIPVVLSEVHKIQ